MHFCCFVGMSVYSLWAVSTVRCCGMGSLNYPCFFSSLLRLSFFLSQDNINEATDETKWESHPGQHVRIPKLCLAVLIRTHHSVDDRPAHHKHTWEKQEDRLGECEGIWSEEEGICRQFHQSTHTVLGCDPSLYDRIILTCQDLEYGSEEETSTLDHFEQLIHKRNEREEAEEHGQDHEGLHCLDPV